MLHCKLFRMNEFGCDQNIVFIWLGWYHADISEPPEINNALCGGKLSHCHPESNHGLSKKSQRLT